MNEPERLVLASQSASRQAMLQAAGVAFEAIPAPIDEGAIKQALLGTPAAEIARQLALAKAAAVSETRPLSLVLGSDSLAVVDGRIYDKPRNRDEAASHLRQFSGATMQLHSAAALVQGGALVWSHADVAQLRFRALSDDFIESYLCDEWPAVAACVGVFRIEGRGIQLFEQIEGSHFTILGMPLLPLLAALREQEIIAR